MCIYTSTGVYLYAYVGAPLAGGLPGSGRAPRASWPQRFRERPGRAEADLCSTSGHAQGHGVPVVTAGDREDVSLPLWDTLTCCRRDFRGSSRAPVALGGLCILSCATVGWWKVVEEPSSACQVGCAPRVNKRAKRAVLNVARCCHK